MRAARNCKLTFRRLAAFAAAAAVVGCATPPPAEDKEAMAAFREANDPIEPLNRYFFEVNRGLDELLLRPVAEIYRGVFPRPVRDGVRNFVNNLRSPVILANDLLQGEGQRAHDTLVRGMGNTFAGFGGVVDVAAGDYGGRIEDNIPYHSEDFGQTLAVWGVHEGPYLVLPLIGPSPVRDTVGIVGDTLMDPFTWIVPEKNRFGFGAARYAARGIDTRSRNIETLDEIERSSIDFYATIRSLYRQRRAAEIANGRRGAEDGALPDLNLSLQDDKGSERVSQLPK